MTSANPPAVLVPAGHLPAAPAERSLPVRWLVVVALSVVGGAWLAAPTPRLLAVVAIAVGVAGHRPTLLAGGGLLLASALGASALSGLGAPDVGPVDARAVLVTDPTTGPFGTTVEASLGGHRWLLRADGAAGGAIASSLAGEEVALEGTASRDHGRPWMVPRHLAGTISVRHAERVGGGAAPWRAANRFRRLLDRGSAHLDADVRTLYRGMVLGDDRGQRPEQVDDFRATGLTHLLVVSGQNLAFVLVVLRPLLERVSWRWRWGATLAVIGGFAVVTRFEPSVLRASAMAAIAVTGAALGRPQRTLRTLLLAVIALVLIDPLLVRSVGFQLSVGASLGLAVLAGPVARCLPGPRPLADVIAATVAAQAGVAPFLVPVAGGVPVVALVANPLAVPVAGLVTTWGLPAGIVAGLGGGVVARIVHLPTQVLVGWVDAVARNGARIPLGELRGVHLLALAALGFLGAVADRRGRWLAVAAALVVVSSPAVVVARWTPSDVRLEASGTRLARTEAGVEVEVVGSPRPLDLLTDLRRAGIRRIDRLVVAAGDDETVALLSHRWAIGSVVVRVSPGAEAPG